MRTCVILMPGLSGRMLDSIASRPTPVWFDELRRKGVTRIRPVLPAVTMPVQATYTTGVTPAAHGIVANGFAPFHNPELLPHLDSSSFESHRRSVSFWEQSNEFLTAPRLWNKTNRKTAMLFLQSSMGGAADVVVTPKPTHTPDGKTVSTCWSNPPDLYPTLRAKLGEFPLLHYWGPMAGVKGSQWIVAAAQHVWESHPCDLQWTYIPQLDYDLQRWGPDDPRCAESLSAVLSLLTPFAEQVTRGGGHLLIAGEYGMTPVSRSAAPNSLFREAGMLKTTPDGSIDYPASSAFALCDHQVAHVYCRGPHAVDRVEQILRTLPEVGRIYAGKTRSQVALDSDRAGEVVAFAQPDAWFEYRWWEDWSEAPPFAWTVDIHRKPGYDPTELFFDPVKKRIRADEPNLVKGSHGAMPTDERDWPVLIPADTARGTIDATQVAALL